MRKIIPLILTLTVLLSVGFCSSTAHATEVGSTNVMAEYLPGAQGGQIISVEIAWEGMDFTYKGASENVWDADKHQYIPGTTAGWAKSDAYISITNHSNVMLKAGIVYTGNPEFKDMGMAFTDRNPFVGSAETQNEGEGKECTVMIRAIPIGNLPPETPADTKVGEIKVTVMPEESYQDVLGVIQDALIVIPVNSDSLSRQDVCFANDTAKKNIDSYLQTASEAVNSDKTSDAEKNFALNELLSNYYSMLHFSQDFSK